MYRKRAVSVALFAVASLGAAGILLLLPSYFFLRSNGIVLATERDTLAGYATTKMATALAGTVSDMNGRLRVFPDTEAGSPLIAGLIDPILKVQDPAIQINEFDYKPGTASSTAVVTVSGTADTRNDLLAFADKVKGIASFSNVQVPIGSFIKDSNIGFSLSANVALKH